MADNIGYTPGSGATVAADEIGGVLYQRVKPAWGVDGTVVDVSDTNPLPTVSDHTDNLLTLLSRVVKLLESNAVVDQQQRQRVTIDSVTASPLNSAGNGVAAAALRVTLASDSTGVLTSVANLAATAGMDREQWINTARQAYALTIRPQLQFT